MQTPNDYLNKLTFPARFAHPLTLLDYAKKRAFPYFPAPVDVFNHWEDISITDYLYIKCLKHIQTLSYTVYTMMALEILPSRVHILYRQYGISWESVFIRQSLPFQQRFVLYSEHYVGRMQLMHQFMMQRRGRIAQIVVSRQRRCRGLYSYSANVERCFLQFH